jgi:undecaprenyl-diphosphatase
MLLSLAKREHLPALLCKTPEYPWRRHWFILSPLVLIICAAGVMHGFWGEQPQMWYAALRKANPHITVAMRAASKYSALAVYCCYVAVLVCAIARKEREKIALVARFVLVAVVFDVVLTQLLKAGFGMPRPGHALPVRPFSFLNVYSSFPSGHTVAIITAALPLALWIGKKKAYALFAILIASVGFSRVWLGVHHPVDILGGIIVGTLSARLIFCDTGENRCHR